MRITTTTLTTVLGNMFVAFGTAASYLVATTPQNTYTELKVTLGTAAAVCKSLESYYTGGRKTRVLLPPPIEMEVAQKPIEDETAPKPIGIGAEGALYEDTISRLVHDAQVQSPLSQPPPSAGN